MVAWRTAWRNAAWRKAWQYRLAYSLAELPAWTGRIAPPFSCSGRCAQRRHGGTAWQYTLAVPHDESHHHVDMACPHWGPRVGWHICAMLYSGRCAAHRCLVGQLADGATCWQNSLLVGHTAAGGTHSCWRGEQMWHNSLLTRQAAGGPSVRPGGVTCEGGLEVYAEVGAKLATRPKRAFPLCPCTAALLIAPSCLTLLHSAPPCPILM